MFAARLVNIRMGIDPLVEALRRSISPRHGSPWISWNREIIARIRLVKRRVVARRCMGNRIGPGWATRCAIFPRASFHAAKEGARRRRMEHGDEIFIFPGAEALGEARMGRAVRATGVQRRRWLVPHDSAAEAARLQLLEACRRNYQRFHWQAEERRPNFRPVRRHGDSFLGPEELLPVSVLLGVGVSQNCALKSFVC